MADVPAGGDADAVDESKLMILHGCCCCNSSLYLDCPACLGCSGNFGLCCLECETCCKPDTKPLCCACIGCKCTKCESLCHGQEQCCCIVESCAFPTTAEVPALIACCFVVCYPKCTCCATQGVVTGTDLTVASSGAPSSPDVCEMARL